MSIPTIGGSTSIPTKVNILDLRYEASATGDTAVITSGSPGESCFVCIPITSTPPSEFVKPHTAFASISCPSFSFAGHSLQSRFPSSGSPIRASMAALSASWAKSTSPRDGIFPSVRQRIRTRGGAERKQRLLRVILPTLRFKLAKIREAPSQRPRWVRRLPCMAMARSSSRVTGRGKLAAASRMGALP